MENWVENSLHLVADSLYQAGDSQHWVGIQDQGDSQQDLEDIQQNQLQAAQLLEDLVGRVPHVQNKEVVGLLQKVDSLR